MVCKGPIHAILHEICSDLRLVPADPLWDEINAALRGAGFLARWKDAMKRASPAPTPDQRAS